MTLREESTRKQQGTTGHRKSSMGNTYSVWQKKEVAGNESLSWLAVGDLKKETEDPIMACQDQALRTNVIKANIEHKSVSIVQNVWKIPRECRTEHTVCSCSKLAQRGNKLKQAIWHSHWPGQGVQWELCKVYDLPIHIAQQAIRN